MKSSFPKIFVYASLALLASFLFFWLYQEYQDEKTALQNERDLKVAKELFNYSGLDLNAILEELRGEGKQVSVKIDMSGEDYGAGLKNMEDSMVMIGSRISKTQIDDSKLDVAFGQQDSFKVIKALKKKAVGTMEGDVAIVYATELDSFGGQDSIGMMASSDFHQDLKERLAAEEGNISNAALMTIWPQSLFALFLFSLMTLAIFLLQKNFREQQILLENKNNLISNITHELKTPVSSIGVALEAIQDFNVKSNPEKANAYIDLSRSELQRLDKSIDQVLQLSKMDSNHKFYQFENKELLPLCNEVVDNLELQIQQKNVQLNITSNQAAPKAILDVTHFKNMLYNLVDNSLKYGKKGGSINIDINQKNETIQLGVSDDGIGIGAKYLDKIFERFFRVPQGDLHNVKGYGLGLSYVKEIVKVHNWSIDIESKENQGTTVNIKIPAVNG